METRYFQFLNSFHATGLFWSWGIEKDQQCEMGLRVCRSIYFIQNLINWNYKEYKEDRSLTCLYS